MSDQTGQTLWASGQHDCDVIVKYDIFCPSNEIQDERGVLNEQARISLTLYPPISLNTKAGVTVSVSLDLGPSLFLVNQTFIFNQSDSNRWN